MKKLKWYNSPLFPCDIDKKSNSFIVKRKIGGFAICQYDYDKKRFVKDNDNIKQSEVERWADCDSISQVDLLHQVLNNVADYIDKECV